MVSVDRLNVFTSDVDCPFSNYEADIVLDEVGIFQKELGCELLILVAHAFGDVLEGLNNTLRITALESQLGYGRVVTGSDFYPHLLSYLRSRQSGA